MQQLKQDAPQVVHLLSNLGPFLSLIGLPQRTHGIRTELANATWHSRCDLLITEAVMDKQEKTSPARETGRAV